MRTPTRALILAAVAATGLLAACTDTTPSGVDNPQPTDNPSVGITTHSVVTSGTGVTAPPTNSTVGQVANWWAGGGKDRTTAITNDLNKISNDSTDPTTMNRDCATLSTDISAAQSYKPVPDSQAQQHWSAALDKYQQAATDCQAGTSTMSTDLITKAASEISAGTTELNAATARLQQINAGG